MSEPYLVSFDTDRIKDYVFATEKLREIRGASRLIDELNQCLLWQTAKQVCPDAEEVFFGGGSGALLAPSEAKAKEIIMAVEELYRRETFTASISGACLPLAPATRTSGFGKRMETAAFQLRQIKDEKARRMLVAVEPYTQPCASCERHPAAQVFDQEPLCASCAKKRTEDEERRKIEEEKRREAKPAEPRLAVDLNELGDKARPPGYIGFIYADGNNMGDLLARPDRVEDYRKLADRLSQLVRDSIHEGLKKYSAREEIQPYEKLLVGGDDLVIVTAGDLALDAALDMADRFESQSSAVLQAAGLPAEKLTLAMGVVLAHATFPIAAFRQLAEQLLKRAKRRCAEEGYETSAIDFMVVTAAGSSDVKTLRDETLTQESFVFPHAGRQVRLTQRPYTLPEARKLIGRLKEFKQANFPRSQLQFLYEGLFHSQVEAIYRWGKVAGRVNDTHHKLLTAFYKDFGDGAAGLPPWRRDNNPPGVDHTSALGDLIEIYPFVPV